MDIGYGKKVSQSVVRTDGRHSNDGVLHCVLQSCSLENGERFAGLRFALLLDKTVFVAETFP